jgi:hypothetical protein
MSAGTPVSLIEIFVLFPQSFQENYDIVPRLGQCEFLPDSLQFIIKVKGKVVPVLNLLSTTP